MSGFSRRGACPSLAAPMQTGDGLLARLVFEVPDIKPAKLISLLQISDRLGNGIVEITMRGSLQIRGLTEASAQKLSSEVDNLDLDVGGLPITMNALAGLDPDAIANPLPIAESIQSALSPELRSGLAPKTSIVVDGGGQSSLGAIKADIRFQAIEAGGPKSWLVSVGGDAQTARSVGLVDEGAAASVAIRLLTCIAELGPDARGRNLARAELAKLQLTRPPISATAKQIQTNAPIGRFDMSDNRCAIGFGLPFGAAHATEIIELLCSLEKIEGATTRPVPGRGLVVHSLQDLEAGKITQLAAKLGFVTQPDDPRLQISTCAGFPFCISGEIETRKLASQIAACSGSLLDGSFTLHISGCGKRCADMSGPRLTILGKPGHCQLLNEMDSTDDPAIDMPVAEVPEFIHRLDALYSGRPDRCMSAKEFQQDQWCNLAPVQTDQR